VFAHATSDGCIVLGMSVSEKDVEFSLMLLDFNHYQSIAKHTTRGIVRRKNNKLSPHSHSHSHSHSHPFWKTAKQFRKVWKFH